MLQDTTIFAIFVAIVLRYNLQPRGAGRFKSVRLQLHGAICRPNSFILMLRYCTNLKAVRYESTSLNRIVADKLHHVIVA